MGDLQFLDPQRLWLFLVIPVLVAVYVWAVRRKNRAGMRFTNTAVLDAVAPRQSQWRRHLAVALSLLSLVTLIIAWARPNGVEKMPRERATIVLVIDVSLSMEATDVKPTRLAAAQQLSIEFVKSLPEQYNLSLVSLSGNPAVRMPPTVDRGLAERAINALTPAESTAVGDAIVTALSALKIAPKGDDGTVPPGAIVLLSDGQNTAGRSPMQAASDAHKEGVPIHTIAYGSDNGWVDLDGQRERVPPDKEMLRSISELTDGRAWEAETASDLSQVYQGIRSQVGYEEVKKEVTATWAGYGLVFAVLAAMAAVSMGARWP